MEIKEADINSEEGKCLIEQLSNTLEKITENSGKHSFNNDDMKNERSVFVIGWNEDRPIACGAIREISDEDAELKRMFACDKGNRFGKQILLDLENRAKRFKYKRIILETRRCNENAVNFYLHNGYKVIENYGKYKDRTEAICFEKLL